MTERPASPQTNRLVPAAASGALCVTVAVLLAPPECRSTRWVTSALPATAVTDVTGPRQAQSMPTRCGPRSHRAPFSCRHGVLNGLSGCSAVPSQIAAPPDQPSPDQPPRACSSVSQARISVLNRQVKNTTEATPAPPRPRRPACPRRRNGQRDRLLEQQVLARLGGADGERRLHVRRHRERDRVHASRNAPKSAGAIAPYSAASAAAAAGSRPQTAASSAPGVLARAGACVIFAQ